MKKLMLYAILPMAIIFTACDKDGPEPTVTSTKVGFLTNGSWKITAVVSDEDGNGSYETDDYATFPSCFTDNFFTFKTNFQLEINEGPTKCDPTDLQIELGTWSLVNNEANIMLDGDIYPINELTNTTLKWREDGPGNTSSIVTFTKR